MSSSAPEFYTLPLTVGESYAIVGLKLQSSSKNAIMLPVLSKFDPATGRTEWSGSGGGVAVASPKSLPGPTVVTVGDYASFVVGWDNTTNKTWGMMRGVRLERFQTGEESGALRICYQSTGLYQDTWLQLDYPETEGIEYRDITL